MFTINRFLLAGVLLCMLVSGCAQKQDSTNLAPLVQPVGGAQVTPSPAKYAEADCPFEKPGYMTAVLKCGYLEVPEDRTKADGPTIKLAVAVIKAGGTEAKADPMIFMIGGPMGNLSFVGGVAYLFDEIHTNRDLIVMDQRGVGYSKPNLDCPEVSAVYAELVEQLPYSEAVQARFLDAQKTCHDRLATTGAQLEGYTTAQSVEDLESLRRELGYKTINIYGLGYGSRLALEWINRYPQNVRSVILDAPLPPEVNVLVEQVNGSARVLDLFFKRCAADEKCNTTYPNLESVFYEVVDTINASSIKVPVADMQHGKSYNLAVNGDRLIDMLLWMLNNNSPDYIAQIPQMIFQSRDGKYTVLSSMLSDYVGYGEPSNTGMQSLVYCGTDFTPDARAQVTNAIGKLKGGLNNYFTQTTKATFASCDVWKAKIVPAAERKVITSDVPTMILTGEGDVVAPSVWAENAKQNLSKSFYFEFKGIGGGVLGSNIYTTCFKKLQSSFLDKPDTQPDGSCTQAKYSVPWITFKQ
jgi:pimeloyl-ACP methyl ester carboxylesterase